MRHEPDVEYVAGLIPDLVQLVKKTSNVQKPPLNIQVKVDIPAASSCLFVS